MSEQYYTRSPAAPSSPVMCGMPYRGLEMSFMTDAGVFSKGETDKGTALLLDSLPETLSGKVLDLGCGWGAVGIAVNKKWPDTSVTMTDVNRRALELARGNADRNGVRVRCAESDGFTALSNEEFDWILLNPPIRAGKKVTERLYAEAAEHLAPGGVLMMVIRRQQGAESCMRHLKTLFEKVEKAARSAGYWVLRAEEPIKAQT